MTTGTLPLVELQASLQARSDEGKRDWWERYLKGAARFRGVPTAAIREEVRRWWSRHGGEAIGAEQQLDTCLALLRCEMTEDKVAGMLLLGEHLVPAGRVPCRSVLSRFAELFADGHLADWNAVDWFCVRVLGPLIEASGEGCAHGVAAWVDAAGLWQRRASIVGFVSLAPSGTHAELIVDTAEHLVLDRERFAQTGVAWVLRELRRSRPELVEAFLERHATDMSPEARRQALGRHR